MDEDKMSKKVVMKESTCEKCLNEGKICSIGAPKFDRTSWWKGYVCLMCDNYWRVPGQGTPDADNAVTELFEELNNLPCSGVKIRWLDKNELFMQCDEETIKQDAGFSELFKELKSRFYVKNQTGINGIRKITFSRKQPIIG